MRGEDVLGARMLGSSSGKFRGVLLCDAMAGYGMACRPCVDRLAERWLLDAFQEQVEVVSTLDLARRLEGRSVQERHQLVLLIIQEPHAWAARAALSGFWGTYLAGRRSASVFFTHLEHCQTFYSCCIRTIPFYTIPWSR